MLFQDRSVEDPDFLIRHTFNGTSEQASWWFRQRWHKDTHSSIGLHPRYLYKEKFKSCRWGLRTKFQSISDVGVFCRLTNAYALVAQEESPKFLTPKLPAPVIETTIGGCSVVGRLCVGNTKGLLIPDMITDTELERVTDQLPDSVKLQRTEEQMSALGNIIACNDKVALVHPDLSTETEELVADTLQVETFRGTVAQNPLVGAYLVLNNNAGIVSPDASPDELQVLSDLLDIRLHVGTVNCGCKVLGSGLAINDTRTLVGNKTSSFEYAVINAL